MKKFFLSDSDCWLGGVCGGISRYFGVDSTIIRLITIILIIATSVPVGIGYFLIWLLAPREKDI